METLWEKLLFWKKKPKMLKEGVDYSFIDFNNSDITGICLLMPEYLDVVFHYNKARVVEEGEGARLQFGYTIVHPGKYDIDDLTKDEKLHTIMGELLSIILMNKAENEQTGKDNTQKFNLQ